MFCFEKLTDMPIKNSSAGKILVWQKVADPSRSRYRYGSAILTGYWIKTA
jgi:hypothetical protein